MGNGEKQDHSDFLIVILVIFTIIFQLVWLYKYDWFVSIWYALKFPLYTAISFIPQNIFDKAFFWVFWDNNFTTNIYAISEIFKEYSFSEFTDEEFMNEALSENNVTLREFVSFVNNKTAIFYIPFVICFVYIIKNKIQSKNRFDRLFTIETLGIEESRVWPQIKPVIHDYNKFMNTEDLDDHWFSMSHKPSQYLEKNGLLIENKYDDKDDYEKYGKSYYKIDTAKMYNFLVDELGEPFRDVHDFEFYEKAVLAIIIPKMLKEPKKSSEINKNLAILNSSYPDIPKLKFSFILENFVKLKWDKIIKLMNNRKSAKKYHKEIDREVKSVKNKVHRDVDDIINKYFPKDIYKKGLFKKKSELIKKGEYHPEIQSILDKHYYKKTVFSALLNKARDTGVLASCEFIWLKKYNKDLWYMLSQTGRTACFVEVAGAWAHYLAEKKVERKLVSPMVINAIYAADKYMYKTHEYYDPINKYD